MRLAFSALASLLLVGGLAAPAHAVNDHCVFLRSIDGFNVINDETLVVYSGPGEAYRVNLFGHCPSLRWTEDIAIDSRDGQLCWPSNNHIITRQNGITERCLVDSVLKMAPEEIKALKEGKSHDSKPQ